MTMTAEEILAAITESVNSDPRQRQEIAASAGLTRFDLANILRRGDHCRSTERILRLATALGVKLTQ